MTSTANRRLHQAVHAAPFVLALGIPSGALITAASIRFRVNGADDFAAAVADNRELYLVGNAWVLIVLFFLPATIRVYDDLSPARSGASINAMLWGGAGVLVAISCCLNLLIGTTMVIDFAAADGAARADLVRSIWYVHIASDNLFLLAICCLGAGFLVVGASSTSGVTRPALTSVAMWAGALHLASMTGFVWLPLGALELPALILQSVWFAGLGLLARQQRETLTVAAPRSTR